MVVRPPRRAYRRAVGFEVTADRYARFMGRFSEPLADAFVVLADAMPGQRALDVGCGPGALTARLVDRLGVGHVAAVDPSSSFVAVVRTRWPALDVRQSAAEDLPFDDGTFDVATAQLVVHFMRDPVGGLREMGRVAAGGVVTACVWDHAGDGGPVSLFWRAVADLDPQTRGESGLAGAAPGQLGALARKAGLDDVREGSVSASCGFGSFEDWWDPFTLGVGPAGEYVSTLDDEHRDALRTRCRQLLPDGPFTVTASAWTVVARG